MQKFYLADKEIIKLQISDQHFRVYNYWCSQYNVKTLKPFINYIQTASDLFIPVEKVKKILTDLCSIVVEGDALVSAEDNKTHRRIEFDLPRYKSFLKSMHHQRAKTRVCISEHAHATRPSRKDSNSLAY